MRAQVKLGGYVGVGHSPGHHREDLCFSPGEPVRQLLGEVTRAEFEKSQTSSVNQLIGLVYALVALAVLIALIGIVNTLMLSVFERTREIGLLPAVGMKGRQVRAMVRSESVVISVFGASVGIVIGTGLGVALVSSLKLTDTAVPVLSLVVSLVLSAGLGLVAATWPARRAAKLERLGRHRGRGQRRT